MKALPAADFESRAWIEAHVDHTLAFYERHARDPAGGFFHYLRDDGSVYERSHRHLVSATRFVFDWCMALRQTGRAHYRELALHALEHLQVFRLPARHPNAGLHAWTVRDGRPEDQRALAYGQAFVLLAYSHACLAGLATTQDVAQAYERLEQAFYQPEQRAYADERSADGALLSYRGQNANMHLCEVCLAAFDATDEGRYLDRAESLIERFVFELADPDSGLICEHYDQDWQPDWQYNAGRRDDIFKPWGYQTGHQTEWAKLLLQGNAHLHRPRQRWVDRAVQLQRAAWRHGWDAEHGGLIYGFGPDFSPWDSDKYFWVQAEAMASAWRLWRASGDADFRAQYHRLWDWSWRHLVDHEHGAWFRILAPDGAKLEVTKSPAGKTDYHTLGACWDILAAGGLQP